MRKIVIISTIVVAVVLAIQGNVLADNPIPKKGGVLPAFSLTVPESDAHKAYLGLSGSGDFTIPDIHAKVVILEVYSMYCPHCQREAPRVNELYEAIENNPRSKGRVKLIGLAAGNSPYEVDFFRQTYKVPFPLFDDKHYEVHDLLGTVRTPFFIGVKINEDKSHTIFYTNLGGFEKANEFLELLLKESGLQ